MKCCFSAVIRAVKVIRFKSNGIISNEWKIKDAAPSSVHTQNVLGQNTGGQFAGARCAAAPQVQEWTFKVPLICFLLYS